MGKTICPACKAEIEENSKFCPECGTNIEELKKSEELKKAEEARMADEAKRVQGEKKFCINCGAELATDSVFCPECGTNQNTGISYESDTKVDQPEDKQQTQPSKAKIVQNNTNETSNASLSDEDELLMRAYITGTTDPYSTIHHYNHYKKAFTKFSATGSKFSWSWAGFLVTAYNLIARRNYLVGIIILIVSEIISLLMLICNGNDVISTIMCLILLSIGIIFGSITDYLHYKRCLEKISLARSVHKDNLTAQISYMSENGGFKNGSWIIACIVNTSLTLLIGFNL